jgi:hypothetical protein
MTGVVPGDLEVHFAAGPAATNAAVQQRRVLVKWSTNFPTGCRRSVTAAFRLKWRSVTATQAEEG